MALKRPGAYELGIRMTTLLQLLDDICVLHFGAGYCIVLHSDLISKVHEYGCGKNSESTMGVVVAHDN